MAANDLVVVIGCSKFGAAIANECSSSGKHTAVIDINPIAFRKLDNSYSGYTIEGDAMDKDILLEANINEATEVDIMTNSDNTNIFLASLILHYYRVPLVIVRLQDEKKSRLLKDKRVRIISPALLSINTYHQVIDTYKKNKEGK